MEIRQKQVQKLCKIDCTILLLVKIHCTMHVYVNGVDLAIFQSLFIIFL